MVNNAQEHYQQLVAWTLLHLLQEHPAGEWMTSDADTCAFFRQRLQRQPASRPAPAPVPVRVPAPPPPIKVVPKQPVVAVTPKPLPAPPPVEKVEEPPQKAEVPTQESFVLSEYKPRPSDEMADWKRILSEVVPKLTLLDTPPSSDEAITKRLQSAKVWIICEAGTSIPQRKLLGDLAHAITLHYAEACVVSRTQLQSQVGKPSFVLTVAGEANLDVPTLQLPNLDQLLEDPDAKVALWNTISGKLGLGGVKFKLQTAGFDGIDKS